MTDVALDLEAVREFRSQLLTDLTKYVSSATIQAAAKRLKLWQHGSVYLDEEDATAGLTFLQYCMLDFARNGTTALERYMVQHPPETGSIEERFLDSLAQSSFTIHKVLQQLSEDEVELEDVSNGQTARVREKGFWSKAKPGILIATRLVPLGDVVLTSGVFFGLTAASGDDDSPPRIPPVSNRLQAVARTEALLQSLLHHDPGPASAAPAPVEGHDLA